MHDEMKIQNWQLQGTTREQAEAYLGGAAGGVHKADSALLDIGSV